jgi:hypothetical protein
MAITKFIFDQIDDEGHPNDPVIGCLIGERSMCLQCGKHNTCRYEGAARKEVA